MYKQKLELLLNDKIKKENYNFDKIPFILFGAGNLGVRTLEGLKKINIEPMAFGDNDENKIGSIINGILVINKENIMDKYGKDILIVLTIWGASTAKKSRVATLMKELKEYGFENVIDITKLYNIYSDLFLPHYCLDLPEKVLEDKEEIIECYELFADISSKEIYYEQIRWRLLHDNWEEFIDFDCVSYFKKDIYDLREDDIIYDCGAFDGDTLRMLLDTQGCFQKIISFEPDKENFNKLMDFLEGQNSHIKSKVECYEYALGDKEEILLFEASGNASSTISDNGSCEVKSIMIDKFVEQNKKSIPTIIKMDIDGFEEQALIGSKNTIEKYKPILAICVYHKQNDLWKIPLLINKMNKEYTLYLRRHGGDCFDTVLYAIPKERCKR